MATLKIIRIFVCILTTGTALSTASLAKDVHCPPHLGDIEVGGNVLVAASCELDKTRVDGNVTVFAGGSLRADGAEIEGNVDARNAATVVLLASEVEGNVHLAGLVGDLSRIVLSEIDGNIRLTENRSRLEVQDSRVDGNVDADRNVGGLLIADNVIEGNLSCQRNTPAPIGDDNRILGKKQDQCENLRFDAVSLGGGPGDAPNLDAPPSGGGAVSNPPPSNPDPATGGTGGTGGTAPGGDVVLNRQPSGGGSAVGPFEALWLALMLLAVLWRRSSTANR